MPDRGRFDRNAYVGNRYYKAQVCTDDVDLYFDTWYPQWGNKFSNR